MTGAAGRMGGRSSASSRQRGPSSSRAPWSGRATRARADAGLDAGWRRSASRSVDDLAKALAGADVVIDFTSQRRRRARAALRRAGRGARHRLHRLHPEARARGRGRRDASRRALAQHDRGRERAVRAWPPGAKVLGEGYDVEILEVHHKMKRDAPSAPRVRLAEVPREALERDPATRSRTRATGILGERPPGRSACRRCAAATSWASTRCTSAARASGSSSPTAPPAASSSPAARCAPRAGSRAAGRALRHGRRARARGARREDPPLPATRGRVLRRRVDRARSARSPPRRGRAACPRDAPCRSPR